MIFAIQQHELAVGIHMSSPSYTPSHLPHKYISCYSLSLHSYHCLSLSILFLHEKTKRKPRKLKSTYFYFYCATDHGEKSNLDINEIKK